MHDNKIKILSLSRFKEEFLIRVCLSIFFTLFAFTALNIKQSFIPKEIFYYVLTMSGIFPLAILLRKIKYNVIIKKFSLTLSFVTFTVLSSLFFINYSTSIAKFDPKNPMNASLLIVALYALISFFYLIRDSLARFVHIQKNLEKKSKTNKINEIILISFIILVFFSIRLTLIKNAALENDEGYTYAVNLGFLRLHELGLSETGVKYLRTPIYNFFNSLILFYTKNPLYSLRLFNIIFFSSASLFIYKAINKLYNKSIAFISFFLININWYLNSILQTGRSYTFSIVFSFFSLFFLISALLTIIFKRTNKELIINIALGTMFLIFSFFEGHITATYHAIPLLFFIAVALFLKANKKIKIIGILTILSFLLFLFIYIFLLNPSFGFFIQQALLIKPNFKFLDIFGSLFFYYSFFGIFLIIIIITLSLIVAKKNDEKNIVTFCLACYCVYVYLIHSFLLSKDTKYFTYYSDLVIPLILLLSVWLNVAATRIVINRNSLIIRLCVIMLFLVISSTSIYNLLQLKKGKISFQRINGAPFIDYFNQLPKNSVVLTDQPLIALILKPSTQCYSIFRWINDDEFANADLIQDVNTDVQYSRRIFTNPEKIFYENFILNESAEYIKTDKQLYNIYTGSPLVMDLHQLKSIIASSKDKEVYLVFTHTAYNGKARARNPELYDYLMQNMTVMEDYKLTKNIYDDQSLSVNEQSEILTLAKIK